MTIESIFLAAVKRGPIIILDNMKDRTHAATTDPLVDHSPLIRLAILAVDLGADPDQIEFNGYVTRSTAPGGWSASAVMYNVGADCPELTRALQSGLPTLGFHYCPLNAMYFVDEFGAYGQRIKADRAKDGNENVRDPIVWIDPAATRFDRGLGKHYRVVDRIREHFERRGWITAAERLAKCLAPPNPVQSESAASAVRFPEGSPVAEAGQTEEAAKARAEACIVIVSPDGQPVRDILVGHPVTLRNDDNSGVCAWRWSMLSKPDGSTVSVHRATSSVLNFTPDVAGLYQFRLQVNGAELASMRSEVGLCAVNASAPSKGAGAKARADAELAREAKREFAEHVIVTDGIRDAKARGTDPDRAIVGLSNPIGERFEPGTPEAAARSERVSPPTPWEQICARAHALGYHAHVERAPATTDADELRIVLRRATYYADKSGLSIIDREKFEADLTALNQYLVDEHACTNPDGSPKVGLEAQLGGVPDESGPAAALRLLNIARFRGAFLSTSPISKLYEMIEARDRTIEALTKECEALKVELGKARADRELAQAADRMNGATSERTMATVAAFVQRHTGMGTAELARIPGIDLLDLADTVLKQDRQQAHEEMSAKMKRRVDQWEEIKDLAAELGLRGKDGQTLPQILREALTGGNDIALLRRLAEDRRVESNKAKELDQICDLLNAYGHLKTESTLEQNLRRVFSDLQHWRTFTHRQARRTGAAMPKDGELTAEQAVAHFDLIVTFGKKIADDLQQVSDLVLDRQSRMSANASKAVGLLDVLRGLIADAHVPSVDARDMAELRARAEGAEAAHDAAEAQLARITAPAGQTSCTQVTRESESYELHVASIGDLLGEGAYKINVANPATIRRRGDSRDFTVIGCRGYEYDAPLGAGTIYLHPECTGDNFREGTVLKLKV